MENKSDQWTLESPFKLKGFEKIKYIKLSQTDRFEVLFLIVVFVVLYRSETFGGTREKMLNS